MVGTVDIVAVIADIGTAVGLTEARENVREAAAPVRTDEGPAGVPGGELLAWRCSMSTLTALTMGRTTVARVSRTGVLDEETLMMVVGKRGGSKTCHNELVI